MLCFEALFCFTGCEARLFVRRSLSAFIRREARGCPSVRPLFYFRNVAGRQEV